MNTPLSSRHPLQKGELDGLDNDCCHFIRRRHRILAEAIGRVSANRQARAFRALALEDARKNHEIILDDEARRELRTNERDACAHMIESLQSSVPLVDQQGLEVDDQEVMRRTLAMAMSFYIHTPKLSSPELRERLNVCVSMLDLATIPDLSLGPSVREVNFIVRNNVYAWLGAQLRLDSLPAPTAAWLKLQDGRKRAREDWANRLAQSGHTVHPWPVSSQDSA